jgi:hypothetical protein
MMEGGFRSLSLDFMAMMAIVVTAPDLCSKTEEELLLNGFGGVSEVRVAPGICA